MPHVFFFLILSFISLQIDLLSFLYMKECSSLFFVLFLHEDLLNDNYSIERNNKGE
jgi:hypothetical protein